MKNSALASVKQGNFEGKAAQKLPPAAWSRLKSLQVCSESSSEIGIRNEEKPGSEKRFSCRPLVSLLRFSYPHGRFAPQICMKTKPRNW
jgi:hypothetical protein